MQDSLLNNNPFYRPLMMIIISGLLVFQGKAQGWEPMPFKLNYGPDELFGDTIQDKLLVGGSFRKIDTTKIFNYIEWDGSSYQYFSKPLDLGGHPNVFRYYKDTLYAAGWSGISKKIGDTSWVKLNSSHATFFDLDTTETGQLLIGGVATEYGCLTVYNQGIWAPYKGIDSIINNDGWVNGLEWYKGDLYVGGNINPVEIKDPKYQEILRWTPTGWQDVGGGLKGESWINDMVIYKGELYVAGSFWRAAGNADNHIMRWDGKQWKPVGGGVDRYGIVDLEVFDGKLWVVGSFNHAGGLSAKDIAAWDGTDWYSLGSTFGGVSILSTLGVFRNELYIGGGFNAIDGDTLFDEMAKWTGPFKFVDQGHIDYTTVQQYDQKNTTFSVYPNPTHSKIYVDIKYMDFPYRIRNAYGQIVVTGALTNNTLDVATLPHGLYVLEINAKTARFIKK